MASRKKYIAVSLFIILLLFFAAYIHTVEDGTASPHDTEGSLTLVAGFSREKGAALGNSIVRFSSGENDVDYSLGGSGELQITGLPRHGDLYLTVLDPQGQSIGTMTLRFSEGAVIDATTSEDGTGHITLRGDTEVIALFFSLTESGSLQCDLWLTRAGTSGLAGDSAPHHRHGLLGQHRASVEIQTGYYKSGADRPGAETVRG